MVRAVYKLLVLEVSGLPDPARPVFVKEVLLRKLACRVGRQCTLHIRENRLAGSEHEEACVYVRGRLGLSSRESPGMASRIELAIGCATDPGVVLPTNAEAVLDTCGGGGKTE